MIWGVRALFGRNRSKTLSTGGASDPTRPPTSRRVALRVPLGMRWHAPKASQMAKFRRDVTQRLSRGSRSVPVFVKASRSVKPQVRWSEVERELMRELKAA